MSSRIMNIHIHIYYEYIIYIHIYYILESILLRLKFWHQAWTGKEVMENRNLSPKA